MCLLLRRKMYVCLEAHPNSSVTDIWYCLSILLSFFFSPLFILSSHQSLYYYVGTEIVNSWMRSCSLSLSLVHKYLLI